MSGIERRRREAMRFAPPVARRSLLTGCLSMFVLGPAVAQDRPTFRAAAQSVLLQVLVLDAHGVPVGGVRDEDFEVYEDGVLQEVTFFAEGAESGAVPTAIALLVDRSSSMKGPELTEARKAALRFLEEAPPGAEMAIVGFDHETSVVCGFTPDKDTLHEAVHRLDARGGTALYDGLSKAIDVLESSAKPRQLLVVLSDGKDLDSAVRFEDVRRRLAESPITVYSVGYYRDRDRDHFLDLDKHYKAPAVDANLNPAWVLTELAQASGGRAFFPEEAVELDPLFAAIAQAVRLQYVLAYSPSTPGGERRFREIEVRVLRSPVERGAVTVRTRRGYVR